MTIDPARRKPLIVSPGSGRRYDMGGMSSLFLADGGETADSYSISEWWLEPHTSGPGPHSHEHNDDIFYVIEGTITFLVGEETHEVAKGGFVRAPAGVVHDFSNRTDKRAGMLNIYIPGGFEQDMPAIVQWFKENP